MNSLKCVAVGDGAVGKTCLLISYTADQFSGIYVPTVFDNYTANLMHDNEVVQLQLWDTAGQDDYDRLRPLAYPETDVFLVCYSVDSPNSFQNVRNKWYPEIAHFNPESVIVLVGNKTDVRKNEQALRQMEQQNISPITTEEGELLKKEIGAVAFVECSALSGNNVNAVFNAAVTGVKDEWRRVAEQRTKRRTLCTIL